MEMKIRFLILSVAIVCSSISASLLFAMQTAGQDHDEERRSADATVTEGIENYVRTVDIGITEFRQSGTSEFDVRFAVAVVDEKEEAISSVDIVCPSGETISITRERRDFGSDRDFSLAARQKDGEPLVFAYTNIGARSIERYGSGDYTVRVNHESGTDEILIPSVDPATGAKLQRPDFPQIVSDHQGTLTSPIEVKIEKSDLDAGLFFGKEDREGDGFLEEVSREIPAGETTVGPIDLSGGDWGGHLYFASKNSGVAKGISWAITLTAVVVYDFSVK